MEQKKIIRSAGVVGGLTMVSRLLGLTRDVLMAGFFGASGAMSAFVLAFTIPNLFRRLFGEGALSSSFVPVFVEARNEEGDEAAWGLARRMMWLVAVFLSGVVVVGVLTCSLLIAHPAWLEAFVRKVGRPELMETLVLFLPLLRVMLPYVVLICLAALSMGILNSFHHFAIPAATPALLNVIWILAVLFIVPLGGGEPGRQIFVVAWAVVLAGVVQLAFHYPVLRKYGFRIQRSPPGVSARVGRVLRLAGPAALGLAVTQFNVMVDRLLAAWVGPHAPAALFFSERLIYFPLGIFATAIGTVLLPVLSGHAAANDRAQARETLNHSMRTLLFLMVPAAVGLFVLATPIVQMIFEWREFTPGDTVYTSIALSFYAPGLVVFSLAKIFVPAFYAHQDTRTPVLVGVGTVVLNLVLNITFVLTWPQPIKHAGLACATVISEGVYAWVLAILLHRRLGSPGWGSILASGGKVLAAALVMGLSVHRLYPALAAFCGTWLPVKAAQVVVVALLVGAGLLVYLLTALLLRCRELAELRAAGRRG